MKKTKILSLLLVLLGLALVNGCTPMTETPEVPEETTYTVTIASGIENGTVSTDKTSAKAGETVKLTVTPNDGYQLGSLTVVDSSSNAITTTSNTFTMPESNVTVNATFTETPAEEELVVEPENEEPVVEEPEPEPTTEPKPEPEEETPVEEEPTEETPVVYSISIVDDIVHGTVTANKTDKIAAGETITLTVTPETGYELDTLSVKNGDTEITVTNNQFTMPAENVTVSAEFKKMDITDETDNGESEEREYTVSYLFDYDEDGSSDYPDIYTSFLDEQILDENGDLRSNTRTNDQWKQFFLDKIGSIYLDVNTDPHLLSFEPFNEGDLPYELVEVIINGTELKLIFK